MIENLIPEGKENAISRSDLRVLSGLDDRTMRRQINQSEELIINNGDGYFKPSPLDYAEVMMWKNTFMARIRDELRRVRKGEEWMEEMDRRCDLFCPVKEDEWD